MPRSSSTKSNNLSRWESLIPNQPIIDVMRPIPSGTEGSRYGCCGIRIDGPPEFIDAVLSNLKDIIIGENNLTRLECNRQKVKPREGFKAGQNADEDAEVCYIRLHERTALGAATSAFFDRDMHARSHEYARRKGLNPDAELPGTKRKRVKLLACT